jgi:two-component system, CitB family, sensor kinase
LRRFFFVLSVESVFSVLSTPRIRPVKEWARLHLSSQIVLLTLAIVVLTLGTGVAVSILQARKQLDRQSGKQSLAIARTVAQMPDVRAAFGRPRPEQIINPIAERIRVANRASFVVVANTKGIRFSHPDPEKIGQRVSTDPSEPLSGREYVGVQTGSLGKSVRAKVPIRDGGGRIIGLVSVGILEGNVSAQLRNDLPVILIPAAIGLGLGALGAILLARRVKRQTFGLEPREIATLLEQREAMLHGIREGTVATDPAGRVTLVNDEAKRLLSVDDSALGKRLVDIVPPGHAREVLAGNVAGPDEVVLVDDRVLVANRMPVTVRGRTVGAVVTLRDRTELEGLMRELDDVRSLADALRAQEHEFSHRLHVVAGLIELGRNDEAVRYISHSSLVHQALVASIVENVDEPTIMALLLGKAAVASERGVELRISDDTRLPEDYADARDLVTVLGNLVDNALDSVASTTGGWIEVTIRDEDGGVLVHVHDSGPGVDPSVVDEIFRDGFTTKVATGTGRRGLGLALVSQTVRRREGGYVSVTNEGGALFTAFLPRKTAVEAVTAP